MEPRFFFLHEVFSEGEGATIRLLHCDLEVMGSNRGNNIFVCEGKAAYNDPP